MCVFFFSPSLPDFLGGVHCPLCPKALSLYLSLSYSLFLSFTGHKERGRGRGEVFHLDKEGHGEDSATKECRNREGGRAGGDNKTEKGRCVCVFVFPCFVLFSARCGLGENDRRMSGWRECGCLVWGHVMGNIFMPSGTYSYPGIPRAHTCTRARPHSVSAPCPPTHTLSWDGGEGGERSSTSVMEQEVLEQSALHNIQLPPTCGQDWQAAVVGRT